MQNKRIGLLITLILFSVAVFALQPGNASAKTLHWAADGTWWGGTPEAGGTPDGDPDVGNTINKGISKPGISISPPVSPRYVLPEWVRRVSTILATRYLGPGF
jgi:hypothetical protein